MRTTTIIFAFLGLLTGFASAAPATDPQAIARVDKLLTAYSRKDEPAFMTMLDKHAAMYGTAQSEFYTTPGGIRGLLKSDYRQWTTSAFGTPRNVTVETSGDLQTVFFDAPFTAMYTDRHQRTFVIRFATVWHKIGDRWLLLQSMNAVAMSNP